LGEPYREVFKGNNFLNPERMYIKDFHIINELVIDRGPSPYSLQLEIYFDGNYMTTMIGDGLIISTPNGSTAYNLSAGGSIVQSNCQCICLTPMAPHSLSFRPLIIPINTVITLKKPQDNRNSAWVSLDGATRFELGEND
jgi:NAD+ kinase